MVAGGGHRSHGGPRGAKISVHVHPLDLVSKGSDGSVAAGADCDAGRGWRVHPIDDAAVAAGIDEPHAENTLAVHAFKGRLPLMAERAIDDHGIRAPAGRSSDDSRLDRS